MPNEPRSLNGDQDNFRAKDKKPKKMPITRGQKTGIMFMFAGLLFIATGVIKCETAKETERVNKQVKAYEKTLPADYSKYQQQVEHYRDSL